MKSAAVARSSSPLRAGQRAGSEPRVVDGPSRVGVGFAKTLAIELAPSKIRVNQIIRDASTPIACAT
jgi:NAD(P)-dependent dehydrogenase (short-subunit alcohol dehydrogenase family)